MQSFTISDAAYEVVKGLPQCKFERADNPSEWIVTISDRSMSRLLFAQRPGESLEEVLIRAADNQRRNEG